MTARPNITNRLLCVSLAFLAGLIYWVSLGGVSQAAYNPAKLIDDYTFIRTDQMSQAAIQKFLEGKNSYLATYKDTEYCDNQYMRDNFRNCGKSVLASVLIYDAAKAYGLNPRVILATLQKEQSLITDPDPHISQIRFAMGYGCPDSGSCSYPGFFKQVDWGTWQLRYNYEAVNGRSFVGIPASSYVCDGPTEYYSTGLLPGNKVTFYSTGGYPDKRFTIANAATASMYCYTPHVGPIWETGYSGSYNFVTKYEEWWGSTVYDTNKDKVIVGDWDGDGKATPAIKRGNVYFFDNNNDGYVDGPGDATYSWGKPTDQVFVGKWNGTNDGIALKRGNEYFLDYDNNGSSNDYVQWGKPTDQVIVGNWYGSTGAYDPDGNKDKIGLKRGNQYFLDHDNNGRSDVSYAWGKTTDQVIVGAWYGSDGKDKLGLKRGNYYFFDFDNNGRSNDSYAWGKDTDRVIVGDWYGSPNGRESIGLKRGNYYFLDHNNDGRSDRSYAWGRDTDKLIVGNFYDAPNGKDGIGLKRTSSYFIDHDTNASSDATFVYTY